MSNIVKYSNQAQLHSESNSMKKYKKIKIHIKFSLGITHNSTHLNTALRE